MVVAAGRLPFAHNFPQTRPTMPPFETDYLIIGAGATGLSIADTLLQESNFHITIVDKHA